jgi:hypothetical protein
MAYRCATKKQDPERLCCVQGLKGMANFGKTSFQIDSKASVRNAYFFANCTIILPMHEC